MRNTFGGHRIKFTVLVLRPIWRLLYPNRPRFERVIGFLYGVNRSLNGECVNIDFIADGSEHFDLVTGG